MNASRRWARSRVLLRRALDSKSASTSEVETRTSVYNKAAKDLEAVVGRLERLLHMQGTKIPMSKRAPPFPWEKLFHVVATGIKSATDTPQGPGPDIIDVVATKIKDVE